MHSCCAGGLLTASSRATRSASARTRSSSALRFSAAFLSTSACDTRGPLVFRRGDMVSQGLQAGSKTPGSLVGGAWTSPSVLQRGSRQDIFTFVRAQGVAHAP